MRSDNTLFKLREASSTGLTFKNDLEISDTLNAVNFEYIYNGGGAAVGDVNNDGLKDLFFSGNMVSSRLYLNRGDLEFEDVTELSGTVTSSWCTGASFVDINSDGLLDLYVSVAWFVEAEQRKNLFFINEGNDENGIPRFSEQASNMGLDDNGYSTMAVFFDYDKDQDLDMYLLTNSMEGSQRNVIREVIRDGTAPSTDRFYINNGDGTFANWSKEAGILIEGYGLGVALCDINQDGWIDVYCANDFISSDLLWVNNQDGTFSERIFDYLKHTTSNGMGMDIADFNNDALLDIVVVDMLPMSNERQKMMLAFRDMDRLYKSLEFGYHPQFMRNTLQLNMGKFPDGQYRFSEIGYLAGISQTDWSWAPLMMDFDNDGWKDLLITNGYRKDVTNLDYISDIINQTRFGSREYKEMILVDAMDRLKDVKLPNQIFRNSRDLTFEDMSETWGLNVPTFTNGTITADLDNDGDVDIVINNIDDEVHLYENMLNSDQQENTANYLTLAFDTEVPTWQKIGAKLWIFHNEDQQYIEYSPYRGYKSTVDDEIHVGMGDAEEIDSLLIIWPDGTGQKYSRIEANQRFTINKENGGAGGEMAAMNRHVEKVSDLRFLDLNDDVRLDITHIASSHSDLMRTPSMIRNYAQLGPALAVGDLDEDGLEDMIVGSSRNRSPQFLKQTTDFALKVSPNQFDSIFEDMGILPFDGDQDGDLDLYFVSGGSQWSANHASYQDRYYLNNGKGKFSLRNDLIPEVNASGSCVIACDYDEDGDLDLFVGGRIVPGRYPESPASYLLENENGTFIDRSDLLGKSAGKLGMVTSAIWSDVNMDDKLDLLVVGEWMDVRVLINAGDTFIDQSNEFGLSNSSGWWNSINGADIDNDGDVDYVLGNYGTNSFFKASAEYPLEIYAKDFDLNGTIDPIITHYIDEIPYIVHTRNVMMELIPNLQGRFNTYQSYSEANFYESFTEAELEGVIHLDCKMLESIVLENVEGKSFKVHVLPSEMQFSPVFGTQLQDVDRDGRIDLLSVGNSLSDVGYSGYFDASFGNVLINKGDFEWEVVGPATSNFVVDGDAKAIVSINIGGKRAFVASQSNGPVEIFGLEGEWNMEEIERINRDTTMEGIITNEIYHGSGYLSSYPVSNSN